MSKIQADAQCQIWALPGMELTENAWVGAGYPTLKDYIEAIIKESKQGLANQGFDIKMFDHLPIATFGWIDPKTNEKGITLTCETYDNLPTEDVKDGERIIVKFNPKQ